MWIWYCKQIQKDEHGSYPTDRRPLYIICPGCHHWDLCHRSHFQLPRNLFHLVDCIVLHCIALHCSVLYNIILYYMVLHWITLYCIVSYSIALHCIVLYYIALYCIVMYCTALHYIVLHCIISHCITFYCIVLYRIVLHYIILYCIVLYRTVLYCIAKHCIVLRCVVMYCRSFLHSQLTTTTHVHKARKCWKLSDLKLKEDIVCYDFPRKSFVHDDYNWLPWFVHDDYHWLGMPTHFWWFAPLYLRKKPHQIKRNLRC